MSKKPESLSVRATKTALKIGFVVLVFWWLSKKNLISIDAFVSGLRDWPRILLGALAMIAATILSAFRWRILLVAQDIRLEMRRLLQLHFIGNFFNVALP